MYCFREREKILDFMEELTGTRFHTNYNLIGGARYDLDAETGGKARELADEMERCLGELRSMTGKSARVPRPPARASASSRATWRWASASPVRCCAAPACPSTCAGRGPTTPTRELEFDVPMREAGDALARFEVRLEEIAQSARIVRQILDGLPEGPIFTRKPLKNPKATRVKEGETYAAVESPRGELGFYLVADGKAPSPTG